MSNEFNFMFFSRIASLPAAISFELLLYIFLFIAVLVFFLSPGGVAWALSKSRAKNYNSTAAIPGPSGLPLLGLVSAFSTGSLTHRILAKKTQLLKAQKLMAFSVGFTRFVISSHPETAKELLNSSAFADRPIKDSAYELLFHRAMGFAPFGEYWRNLRRISATHLFSPPKIAQFGGFREKIGVEIVEQVKGLMMKNGEVEVRKLVHLGSLKNLMMTVFGKKYDLSDGYEIEDVDALVREGYVLLGVFNWSDHFPVLGWLDLQGVRKRCRKLVSKVNVFVGKIIEEHKMKRVVNGGHVGMNDESCGDFVDVLLDLEKENRLNQSDMIAILWEMIFRGTDTVGVLLEWILARMVLHPDIQAKVQSEIDCVTGKYRPVSDPDLPNLHYLHSVVKETLRMHPPGPLLSWARLSIHDTYISQHFIPAGTTAMVNMWAITHDELFWSVPLQFKPERFAEEDVPIMGCDLRLAPFGSGRRVCPGKAMGLATVELWVAQLVQGFNWLPSQSGVDLSECLKLTLEMKHSLLCKVVPRVCVD